jgi:hypothetical protein
VGDLGIPKFGRIQRQLLAVAALSLTLVAAVLGLGGLAVSQLGVAHPSVGHAPATTAGVYRVVTPVPTPFAASQPRVPAIHAAPSPATTTSYLPPVATPRPAPAVRVVAKAAAKKAPKPRARRRAARKRASKPARAPQPTTAVASVAAATAKPVARPVRTSPRYTRGNSGKPKVNGPVSRAPVAAPAPARPRAWKAPKPKPVHAPKPARPAPAPKLAKPAPAPMAAPPAHGNNGRGHGVGGTPPGAAMGHGKGR